MSCECRGYNGMARYCVTGCDEVSFGGRPRRCFGGKSAELTGATMPITVDYGRDCDIILL